MEPRNLSFVFGTIHIAMLSVISNATKIGTWSSLLIRLLAA